MIRAVFRPIEWILTKDDVLIKINCTYRWIYREKLSV